jgi:hypothetical protein
MLDGALYPLNTESAGCRQKGPGLPQRHVQAAENPCPPASRGALSWPGPPLEGVERLLGR